VGIEVEVGVEPPELRVGVGVEARLVALGVGAPVLVSVTLTESLAATPWVLYAVTAKVKVPALPELKPVLLLVRLASVAGGPAVCSQK
jgi:hypothetical protein